VKATAVEAYHSILEDDAIAQESAQMLKDGQQANHLSFGDRPLSIALRPQLVERASYDAAARASATVFGALRALERALLRDPKLRAELDLLPEEERLALADPGSRYSSPSSRLDGFVGDELRFVEYNAESPAGMAYSDNLSAVFENLPVMRAFRKRFKLRTLPVRSRQLAAMLRAFREWGKARTPVIAIVDWDGLPTLPEFEMFREYFESQGIKSLICDPRELEFSRGRLQAGGVPVNLVYRRVLTSELLTRAEETSALRDAYLAGAACVVNTFRAKLLHKKMSLALLSDNNQAHLYTAEQRCAIERHVPWTRKVREGRSSRGATEIPDLGEYLALHREELVLKPNDEYGGKGVVLGWTVGQTEWEQTLGVAMTQSYVVQEAVPVPRQSFPVALDGIKYLDLAMDMNPYLFEGRASGCLARLSSSALLNVTAGDGSVVPTYIVEGPA
jgi:hypothetical protein